MAENTMQWLMDLISEDRVELRTIRSNISTYSATFLSVIFGVLAASRGNQAILGTTESTYLSIGLVLIYVVIAFERYSSLRDVRNYLNRRETLFLGTDDKDSPDYSEARVQILYDRPEDYIKSNHLVQQLGDDRYLKIIIGSILFSSVLIFASNIIR